MPRDEEPQSPTALGMQTGMDVPGLQASEPPEAAGGIGAERIGAEAAAYVRGTLEEALLFPPEAHADQAETVPGDSAVVPGQSGAEALAELPEAEHKPRRWFAVGQGPGRAD